MPHAAILGEIGAILAAGYVRSLSSRKALADRERPEAACRPVNAAESGGKEVA
jgi:hypothetical protein